jgi:glycosyltransferase involved in cell wall biosynthesis
MRSDRTAADYPLVSIVISAYNHESFVKIAINSVMEQTYPNIELIVFDDGSTDRTGEKIQECCSQYGEKIRFIQQENQGLVKTLNSGIKLSKGKYWCQLASDDLMKKENIRMKVELLENSPDFDAVCSDAFCLNPDQTYTPMMPEKEKPDPVRITHLRDIFRVKIFFAGLMFRKSVFDRIGYFDETLRYSEDLEMKLRLLLYAQVGYIDEPLLVWRSHASNTSKEKAIIRREKIMAYEKIFSLPEMKHQWKLRRKIVGDEYYKYGRFLATSYQADRDHTSSWYLLRSLSLQPLRPRNYYYLIKSSFQNLFNG